MRPLILTSLIIGLMGAGCASAPSPAQPVVPQPSQAAYPTPRPTANIPIAPMKATVEMKDNVFSPQIITIAPGGTVTWTNKGKLNHTSSGTAGAFLSDSGTIKPGASWSRIFSTTGTYAYHDNIYPNMNGTVIVGGVVAQP